MKIQSIKSICISLIAIGAILVSCKKEDIDIIEETTEPIQVDTRMKVSMAGMVDSFPAFAAYCNNNGKELLAVSNNVLLLDTTIAAPTFQPGDFILYYFQEFGVTASIGGTGFLDTVNGTPLLSTIFDMAASVNITSVTSTNVAGNMSGNFRLPSGKVEPYAVEFNALIIEKSNFCD